MKRYSWLAVVIILLAIVAGGYWYWSSGRDVSVSKLRTEDGRVPSHSVNSFGVVPAGIENLEFPDSLQ